MTVRRWRYKHRRLNSGFTGSHSRRSSERFGCRSLMFEEIKLESPERWCLSGQRCIHWHLSKHETSHHARYSVRRPVFTRFILDVFAILSFLLQINQVKPARLFSGSRFHRERFSDPGDATSVRENWSTCRCSVEINVNKSFVFLYFSLSYLCSSRSVTTNNPKPAQIKDKMRKAPETLTSSTSALFVFPGEKQTATEACRGQTY